MDLYSFTSTPVSFPGIGIEDLPVPQVLFEIGSFSLRLYSVCIVLAFALCIVLAMRHAKTYRLSQETILDYGIFIIPSAIIGARVYYVAFAWDEFSGDWTRIFDLRQGGLAVLGGVLLSILVVYAVTRYKKLTAEHVFDYLVVYVPLGQAIGRWGNFFNQEAFGTNTTLPWGMISSRTTHYLAQQNLLDPTLGYQPDMPVHPTFLYESLACVAIFVALYYVRKKSERPFTTTATYFILYGIVRFFIEGLRVDSLYIGSTPLRSSQLLSAILVVVGLVIIAIVRMRGSQRAVLAMADVPDAADQPDDKQVTEQD